MRRQAILTLLLLVAGSLSCSGRSPVAPVATSRLEVYVSWDNQGLPDRRLEILELGLVRVTNSAGIAVFQLPPGSYTLRAFVTVPGPSGFRDVAVTTRSWETERVAVTDCLPCLSAD